MEGLNSSRTKQVLVHCHAWSLSNICNGGQALYQDILNAILHPELARVMVAMHAQNGPRIVALRVVAVQCMISYCKACPVQLRSLPITFQAG